MNGVHESQQPLDSRQLLAFVTLANTASFTLTGKELFLSQSAVSHSIRSLESEFGCRLFDRVGKKVRLNPSGEHLLHYAEKILSDMAAARDSLAQRKKWGQGRLRVGTTASLCHYLLPDVLRDFRREFPDWPVSIETTDTRGCVEMVRQGQLDLALAIAPSRAEPVDTIPLFTDELAWVVSPEHPWVKKGFAPRDEIAAHHFVHTNSGTYTYRLIEKYFLRDGVRPKLTLELASIEALKEVVKNNLGITVLAPWIARKELKDNTLATVPLGKRKLRRNWCVLRSLDRKPTLAEETFLRLCVTGGKSLHTAT
jgi:LysR family transcriptional regulator, low CO2-responsive transcriptional regulator